MQHSQPKQKHMWVRIALSSALATAAMTGTMSFGALQSSVVARAATVNTLSNPVIKDFRYGPLNVNQDLWHYVPYFVSQKTTFFGVWYFQQMLQQQGITSQWDGRSLIVHNLPDVNPNAVVYVNGKALPLAGTVSVNGTTYVNANSVFQALGGNASYDATNKTLSISYTPTSASTSDASSTGTGTTSAGASNQTGTSNTTSNTTSNSSNTSTGTVGGAAGTSTGTTGTSNSSAGSSGTSAAAQTQTSGTTKSAAANNLTSITGGGLTPTSPVVEAAESTLNKHQGEVFVDGAKWKTMPVIVHNNTTFIGVWYMQQVLKQHGISAAWNGKALSVTGLPKIIADANIQLGPTGSGAGASIQSQVVQYRGETLLPVTVLKRLGISFTEDANHQAVHLSTGQNTLAVQGTLHSSAGAPLAGTVAVQESDGTIQLLTAGAKGQFNGSIPKLGSSLIGVRTNNLGWIGEAVPITSSNAGDLQVTANQQMVTLHGKVAFATGQPYKVVQVSVRNVITHAHYYATVQSDGTFSVTVPVGAYEAFALVTESDAVFLVQPFLASSSNTNLVIHAPALPTGQQVSSLHAKVSTADSDVTPEELQSVDNIFEHVYRETVLREGITPTQKMDIHLFGSIKSYQQHYLDEGYSKAESQSISELSVASEEGTNTINILMPTFATVDGLNILAHEFTHALTAEVSQQIPSWANEGGAWTEGVDAEVDQSPSAMLKQGIQWNEWVDIVAHQQNNTLVPLGKASTLSGNYNVEAQDYFAVNQLVKQFGWPKFMEYVRAIDHDPNAFADTFGESFDTFSQQVTAVLKKDAAGSSTGMTIKLRTLPNGPHQIYFINSSGQRFLVNGLEGNQTYTFYCNSDGTVTAPTGLTVTSVSNISVAVQGDWFIGSGGDSSQNRQEFDIVDEFGLPFLDQAILYSSDGNVEHVYPATAIPNGIELISITSGTQSGGVS